MGAAVEETYTPDELAQAVVRELHIPQGSTVLEPSVGGGAFVRALRAEVPGVVVHAYDRDPDATGLNEADWSLVLDTMKIGISYRSERPWNVAVGNPRFGGPDAKRGREPGEPAYIGAHHIAHVLPQLDLAAFILPSSWWGTASVRKVLFDWFVPAEIWPIAGRPWPFLREASVFVWRSEKPAGPTIIRPPLEWRKGR